jgi:hypothetical protein
VATVWFAIKVGVFYGAPIAAVALAIAYFALLLVRVRRGALARRKAAVLYAATLLLPVVALLVVWGTAELASYFAVTSGRYVWDSGEALRFLISLLPLAVYVAIPIAILVASFWATLAFFRKK